MLKKFAKFFVTKHGLHSQNKGLSAVSVKKQSSETQQQSISRFTPPHPATSHSAGTAAPQRGRSPEQKGMSTGPPTDASMLRDIANSDGT
jgi:hypothetical protein